MTARDHVKSGPNYVPNTYTKVTVCFVRVRRGEYCKSMHASEAFSKESIFLSRKKSVKF